jgi:hypothetical protein
MLLMLTMVTVEFGRWRRLDFLDQVVESFVFITGG